MTTLREAAQQALAAIEAIPEDVEGYLPEALTDAVIALRAAIEHAERPRQWQGLRGEEIHYIASKVTPKMVNGMSFVPDWAIPFGREIEAKLREKNT